MGAKFSDGAQITVTPKTAGIAFPSSVAVEMSRSARARKRSAFGISEFAIIVLVFLDSRDYKLYLIVVGGYSASNILHRLTTLLT